MKKLECFTKNIYSLDNELNRQVHKKLLIPDKVVYYIHTIYTNIENDEIILVFHDEVALLMR